MRQASMVLIYLYSITIWSSDGADPAPTDSNKKVVCYYTNWSYKRPPPYDFTPEKIDPFVCTHIIYAFADIGENNTIISSNPEFDLVKRGYIDMTSLKRKNRNLKVMIGLGGWAKGSVAFGRITATEANRREFAKNAVRYLRGYNFDGLDLNWQHPTFREGGLPQDKENYVLLAQALKEEFVKDAEQKSKPRLLLSIGISHHMKTLPAYDIPSFNNYMDFISVICYDYHFSYESAVNHHAPLYYLDDDQEYGYDASFNVNYTINLFLEVADPEKLVLGIPSYGRTYKLEREDETQLGADADGPGEKGPFTQEAGWLAYFEICSFIKDKEWKVVQTKPGLAGPYAFKGNQWVGYDDIDMIRTKVRFAKQKELAGVMFWTVDYDDFLGDCHGTKFPLIGAARNELLGAPQGDMVFPVEKPFITQESEVKGKANKPVPNPTPIQPNPIRPSSQPSKTPSQGSKSSPRPRTPTVTQPSAPLQEAQVSPQQDADVV